MRCRPPLASTLDSRMYDMDYASAFAYKFGGSYPALSAQKRSVASLLQEMENTKIVMAVYEIGYAPNIDVNAEAYDFLQIHGDHFVAMIGTNITDIPASLQAIKQYHSLAHFAGVNIDPGTPLLGVYSKYIDDETLFPIYQLCQDLKLPVTVAFGGYAYPDITAYLPVRIENVTRVFPNLRLCFCHGVWPYTTQICGLALQYQNVYLCPDSYLMLMPSYQDYIIAANYFIPEQILFGTSYPFHAQQNVYAFYLKAGFTDEALPKVMYENAACFLNLSTSK